MTFHLGKLDGLVKTTSEGNYALTDDGKEALRLITAMDEAAGQHPIEAEVGRAANRRERVAVASLIALLLILGPLGAYGAYSLLQPPSILGVVDHKMIGEALDEFPATAWVTFSLRLGSNATQVVLENETKLCKVEILSTWHTVSVRLATDDPVNGLKAGETLAYIVEKADYDRLNPGDLVKGIPMRDPAPRLKLTQVIPRFVTPDRLLNDILAPLEGEQVTLLVSTY